MIALSTSTNHQLSRRWQHCGLRMAKLPEINSTYIINDVDVVIGYWVELESCDMRALDKGECGRHLCQVAAPEQRT